MRSKFKIPILLILMFLSVMTFADRRSYVWTYQYMTMPEGETELELYQTTVMDEPFDEWAYELEIEHGLTKNWDFSVYQVFEQEEGGSLEWHEVKFRTRYKLARDKYFMDPALYLEYKRSTESTDHNEVEAKLILSKTAGGIDFSVNPVYEYKFAPGTEHEAGLDMGVSYEFHPSFSLGLESTTRVEPVFESADEEVKSYVGPTLSFASGNWWYNLGGAVGITDDSADGKVRFLMGIHF